MGDQDDTLDPAEFLEQFNILKDQVDLQKKALDEAHERERSMLEKIELLEQALKSTKGPDQSSKPVNDELDHHGHESHCDRQEHDTCKHHFKPLINKFSSVSLSGPPDRWIQRFEAATKNHWDDQQKADNLPMYLENQALMWLNRSNLTNWNEIKEHFIRYFQPSNCERSEFNSLKYIQSFRSNVYKFVEKKEAKANAAGMSDKEAIENIISHSNLSYEFTLPLTLNIPESMIVLKQRISQIESLLNQSRPQQQVKFNKWNRSSQQGFNRFANKSFYRPGYQASNHGQSTFNRSGPYDRPPPLCPECARRGKKLYHWVRDCRHRQNRPGQPPSQQKSTHNINMQGQGSQNETNSSN